MLGLFPCVILGGRRGIPAPLRGLFLGAAVLLAGAALLGQSRGWLIALPLRRSSRRSWPCRAAGRTIVVFAVVGTRAADRAPAAAGRLRRTGARTSRRGTPRTTPCGSCCSAASWLFLLGKRPRRWSSDASTMPAVDCASHQRWRWSTAVAALGLRRRARLLGRRGQYPVTAVSNDPGTASRRRRRAPTRATRRAASAAACRHLPLRLLAGRLERVQGPAAPRRGRRQLRPRLSCATARATRRRASRTAPCLVALDGDRARSASCCCSAPLWRPIVGAAAVAFGARPCRRRRGSGVVMFAYWLLHSSLDWLWEFPALGRGWAWPGVALAAARRRGAAAADRVPAGARCWPPGPRFAGGDRLRGGRSPPPWCRCLAVRQASCARATEIAASDPDGAMTAISTAPSDLNPLSPTPAEGGRGSSRSARGRLRSGRAPPARGFNRDPHDSGLFLLPGRDAALRATAASARRPCACCRGAPARTPPTLGLQLRCAACCDASRELDAARDRPLDPARRQLSGQSGVGHSSSPSDLAAMRSPARAAPGAKKHAHFARKWPASEAACAQRAWRLALNRFRTGSGNDC